MIQFDAVRLSGLYDIDLPILGASPVDPYQVSQIDGLGPPELNVTLADTHTSGGVYVGRQAQGRQIVVLAKLNPDYLGGQTISDLRYKVYGLLSPGLDPLDQSVTFKLLRLNEPVLQTKGYIKRVEIVPFDKDPRVQITIECLTPYLEKPEPVDLTDSIPASYFWDFTYEGLAPSGIEFEVFFPSPINIFTIRLDDPLGNTYATMDFQGNFVANDRLVVNTNKKSRIVGVKQGEFGAFYKGVSILSGASEWITLRGGTHRIVTNNPSEFTWIYFRYVDRYWGI